MRTIFIILFATFAIIANAQENDSKIEKAEKEFLLKKKEMIARYEAKRVKMDSIFLASLPEPDIKDGNKNSSVQLPKPQSADGKNLVLDSVFIDSLKKPWIKVRQEKPKKAPVYKVSSK
jgi:hypothetical protein